MEQSSIKTTNPTTNQVEKIYPEMTPAEIDVILENADIAFQSWKKTTLKERSTLLHKMATLLRDRKDELGKLCSIEMGKLHREGIGEVELCANIFDYYADNGAEFLQDKKLKVEHGEAFLMYEPLGVLLTVQPWNFPFYQITRTAAANIMGGNTVVLKHASNVPQCAKIMETLFTEAGAPKGVYTNLFLSGSKISTVIADHRVKAASLTGSEPAGSDFSSHAGKAIKKSTLELGGSDAFIVLPDADIDKAVNTAAYGRLWNAGQVCVSPKRIIIQKSMASEFIEKCKAIYENIVIGDPLDPKTELAPLNSEKALNDVLAQVQKAVDQGTTLVYGGKRLDREGAFMTPAILTDIKPDTVAYTDEIFGPVLSIFVVNSVDEAIELANDSHFGLGGSVFGTDIKEAVRVARQITTGMVYINHTTGIAPELPFGGTKGSGFGREQATAGFYEFLNEKLIRITTPDAAY